MHHIFACIPVRFGCILSLAFDTSIVVWFGVHSYLWFGYVTCLFEMNIRDIKHALLVWDYIFCLACILICFFQMHLYLFVSTTSVDVYSGHILTCMLGYNLQTHSHMYVGIQSPDTFSHDVCWDTICLLQICPYLFAKTYMSNDIAIELAWQDISSILRVLGSQVLIKHSVPRIMAHRLELQTVKHWTHRTLDTLISTQKQPTTVNVTQW